MKLVKGSKGERLAARLEACVENPVSLFSTCRIGSDPARRMLVCIVSVHPPLSGLLPTLIPEYQVTLVGRQMTITPYIPGCGGRLPRRTFRVESPEQAQEQVYLFAASYSPF